jgi:hypothetical protein
MFRAQLEETPATRVLRCAIEEGIARHCCTTVIAESDDVPTTAGEPRRIINRRVLGFDIAILCWTDPHFPTTWVKVEEIPDRPQVRRRGAAGLPPLEPACFLQDEPRTIE